MKSATAAMILLFCLTGCSPPAPEVTTARDPDPPQIPRTEGYLDIDGGRIWYRTVGARNDRPPLLLLHGGPGAGSRTFESLEALGRDRLVVLYDQLGAGRSDHPDDPSLWTIERHIQELDLVRQHFGLDQVHILGHSWGSMLLIEYLVGQPSGVVSATFASPLFSTQRWIDDAKQRVKELPEETQRVIDRHEQAGTTDSPDYLAAVEEFYRRFLVRTDPWPDSIRLTMEEFGNQVYNHMWGPSEFTANGTLTNWDRMDALGQLNLPTLFTVGEFDETFPATVKDYASRVPGARFAMIPGAAHITFIDAPETSVQLVQQFLNDVDAGRSALQATGSNQ